VDSIWLAVANVLGEGKPQHPMLVEKNGLIEATCMQRRQFTLGIQKEKDASHVKASPQF
jgi:hypothetical protein